jgi:hypothetical protein
VAVDGDAARVRADQAGDGRNQGGLAGAVGAEQAEKFAFSIVRETPPKALSDL